MAVVGAGVSIGHDAVDDVKVVFGGMLEEAMVSAVVVVMASVTAKVVCTSVIVRVEGKYERSDDS